MALQTEVVGLLNVGVGKKAKWIWSAALAANAGMLLMAVGAVGAAITKESDVLALDAVADIAMCRSEIITGTGWQCHKKSNHKEEMLQEDGCLIWIRWGHSSGDWCLCLSLARVFS